LDAALPPTTVTERLRSEHPGADAAFVGGAAAATSLVGVTQANGTSKVATARMHGLLFGMSPLPVTATAGSLPFATIGHSASRADPIFLVQLQEVTQ
jgi:hypothetical protein